MEDRNIIREIHGIANARKKSMATVADSDIQAVTVRDGFGEVHLCLATSSYPAALTPKQARHIAAQLVKSARRVEANEDTPQ